MVEGSDTFPVIEQQQDVKIIWCGKRNKSQKQFMMKPTDIS
jgi:hypothetical protein